MNDPQVTTITQTVPSAPRPTCRGCYTGIAPDGKRVLVCYRYWWRSEGVCKCKRCVQRRETEIAA